MGGENEKKICVITTKLISLARFLYIIKANKKHMEKKDFKKEITKILEKSNNIHQNSEPASCVEATEKWGEFHKKWLENHKDSIGLM